MYVHVRTERVDGTCTVYAYIRGPGTSTTVLAGVSSCTVLLPVSREVLVVSFFS